jgi:hypothetical protein
VKDRPLQAVLHQIIGIVRVTNQESGITPENWNQLFYVSKQLDLHKIFQDGESFPRSIISDTDATSI